MATLDQMPKKPALRFAVIGYPVRHSLSPQMHLAGFKAIRKQAQFVRIEVSPEEFKKLIEKLREKSFTGWKCTVPHKLEMLKLCDELDKSAEDLQSVNTVWNVGNKLTGYNHDGPGWSRAIKEAFGIEIHSLRIMILGVGGAGQALARQASLEGCRKLVVVNRTFEKANDLVKSLSKSNAGDFFTALPWDEDKIQQELKEIDLVVNCTSIGLKPEDSPVLGEKVFHSKLLVYDTIYRPEKTKFLECAEKTGARGVNGLSMLLHEGALAFSLWNHCDAPIEAMREALWTAAGQKL